MSSAVVLARVEPAIKALIKERVEKEGRTVSDVTRELIEKGLEAENLRRTVELLEKEKIRLEDEKKALSEKFASLAEETVREREEVRRLLNEVGGKVDAVKLELKTLLQSRQGRKRTGLFEAVFRLFSGEKRKPDNP